MVAAVGASVSDLAPGDHVALEVGLPCGECKLCAEGRYNICRGMSFRSSAKSFPHAQGTLQEAVAHPRKFVHKLPVQVPLELGALVEPLSVAMHAGDRSQLKDKKDAVVLVLGAGAVGLLCCAVSKVLGAKKVVVADINADRVAWAVERGFADASVVVPMKRPEGIDAKLEFAREVAALVGEKAGDVDVTFECTGVESCLQAAIYVSVCPPPPTFPSYTVGENQATDELIADLFLLVHSPPNPAAGSSSSAWVTPSRRCPFPPPRSRRSTWSASSATPTPTRASSNCWRAKTPCSPPSRSSSPTGMTRSTASRRRLTWRAR